MTIRHETRQTGLEGLLDWFTVNARDFPWRNTRDPFKVLVAEKLLQQTSVNKHVVNAYLEIIETYPTPEALSLAELVDVERIVLPLGLKYRAAELIRMAKEIRDEYQGKVPSELSEILRLNGVGQYCGRAVLCFAFSQTVPIVDTSIARFLNRFLGLSERLPANPARSKKYLQLQSELLPKVNARSYQLALLDLCACICKPRKPRCLECPVRTQCLFAEKQRA